MVVKWINSTYNGKERGYMTLEYEDVWTYPVSSIKSIEEHLEKHLNCFEEKETELILELINSLDKSNIAIAFEIINQKPEINTE
jgi:hypothetical protein